MPKHQNSVSEALLKHSELVSPERVQLTMEVIGCLPLSAALTALAICNRRMVVVGSSHTCV